MNLFACINKQSIQKHRNCFLIYNLNRQTSNGDFKSWLVYKKKYLLGRRNDGFISVLWRAEKLNFFACPPLLSSIDPSTFLFGCLKVNTEFNQHAHSMQCSLIKFAIWSSKQSSRPLSHLSYWALSWKVRFHINFPFVSHLGRSLSFLLNFNFPPKHFLALVAKPTGYQPRKLQFYFGSSEYCSFSKLS